MKKFSYQKILHAKREKKRLRRLRLGRKYSAITSKNNNKDKILLKIDEKVIKNSSPPLLTFFEKKKFIETHNSDRVTIPKNFNLDADYNESIRTIKIFISIINKKLTNTIEVDFSNCQSVDQPSLFLLQTIGLELKEELKKINNRLRVLSTQVIFKVTPSKVESVNKLLLANGIIGASEFKDEGLIPLHTLGYLRGSRDQKHYSENKKGKIGTKIASYFNACLNQVGYEVTAQGINYLDGLISEILNNAEDHSILNTYYTTANFLKEETEDTIVGELNLSFLNFGYSFFEGFEETKIENSNMYNDMEKLYNQVSLENKNMAFTKENLFTLYALQEGISRLKFEDESRGNGTIRFITSFLGLGDYQDKIKGYAPHLTITTGKTQLICNNQYKCFEIDNVCYLSLNNENSLSSLPDKRNLKTLKSTFPGTLLVAKIYLNKEHLNQKIQTNGTEN